MKNRNIYPFTAIVGQDKIKKALILNAINPSIGGVLIKGDRGTGKTTAVRALTDLLPKVEIVENSPFNVNEDEYMDFQLYRFHNKREEDEIKTIKKCMKLVELPLGATEERIIGSMNIEKGLKEGIKQLEPGILANAHNNVLYIDEINLLDDNLIDILLDSAAFGVNTVEREGISIKHPSKFILIGTMNPEEGELRKQLSDRIGLEVPVKGIEDIQEKIEIMNYRCSFDRDPDLFKEKFKNRQIELKEMIRNAIKILEDVEIEEGLIRTIATVTNNLRLEGHRKDITILKTSKTIAAFEGSRKVSHDNVVEAIELVLGECPDCLSNQDKLQNDNETNNESNKGNEYNEKKDEQNVGSNQNNESNKGNEYNEKKDEQNVGSNQNNESNKGNEYNEKKDEQNVGSNQNNESNKDDKQDEQNKETNQSNESNEHDKQDDGQRKNQDKLEEENESLSNQTQSGTDFKSKENEKEEDLRVETLESQNELNKFTIEELEEDIDKLLVLKGREKEKMYGSRLNSKTEKGKYVKTKFSQDYKDIAIDATLRAAVVHSKNKITVEKEDLRTKIRKHKAKASIAIVIDMSGSMMNDEKINKVKGILDKIVENVNKNRDKLSVIDFKGKESEIIIPNTKRPSSFLDRLEQIRVGGTTPMAAGLKKGYEILKKEKKQGEFIPMLILLSDGMPNVGIKNSKLKTITGNPIKDVLAIGRQLADEKIYTIIINFEKKIKQGRDVSLELAIISNGRYYDLEGVRDSSTAIDKILTYERTLL